MHPLSRTAVFALTMLLATGTYAQLAPPYLVENINTTPVVPEFDHHSRPVAVGDDVYFMSKHGLWRTDGTDGGTYFVAPIPTPLGGGVAFGHRLFYTSQPPGLFLHEVWTSDGTTPGTYRISEGFLYDASPCGDSLCFSTGNGQLKITDGTAAGTRLLATTDQSIADSNLPSHFATVGKRLYFNGLNLQDGRCYSFMSGTVCGELWTSDGTTAGTKGAVDIVPGPRPSSPRYLHASGDKLFLTALNWDTLDFVPERCPFVSDGTAAGTRKLHRQCVPYYSYIPFFTLLGRTYYQIGIVYITDGTPEGTRPLHELLGLGEDRAVISIGAASGKLIMLVRRPSEAEVWSTDFDFGSRTHLFNVQYYADIVGTSRSGEVFVQGRKEGTYHERQLWVTDGTSAGTRLIHSSDRLDAWMNMVSTSRFDFLTAFARAPAIWRTDGTAAGTQHIDNSIPRDQGSSPHELTAVGGDLFFFATDYSGKKGLYRTGLDRVTLRLTDCDGCRDLEAVDGRLYFVKQSETWTSDGTVDGTMPVSRYLNTTVKYMTMPPRKVGDKTLFIGSEGAQLSLYVAGSLGGTKLLELSGSPSSAVIGTRLLIGTSNGLWSSDGTQRGTVRIANRGGDIAPAGNRAFFLVAGSADSLWITDGTPAGTRIVGEHPARMLTVRNDVLFFVNMQTSRLWRTDGTADGTFALSEVGDWKWALDAGPHVALMRPRDAGGVEIWTSDGTREGTRLHREVSSDIGPPVVAPDGDTYVPLFEDGLRLLNLSGRADRTTSLAGAAAIDYAPPTLVGTTDALYLSAYNVRLGQELWAMRFDGVTHAQPTDVSVERAFLTNVAGGRRAAVFRVHLTGFQATMATVRFTTSDGSAIAHRDYTPSSGTLTLTNDVPSKAVIVPVADDGTGTFWLTIFDATGAPIGRVAAPATLSGTPKRRAARH